MPPTSIRVELPDAPYSVAVGPGVAADACAALAGFNRWAVVADARVLELHGAALRLPVESGVLALEGGESAKELPVLGRVLEFCASQGLARSSALLAFGGGTIGDLAGLGASLFKRGIAVVQAPTTLLAQVDASVGGKTAINLAAGKNLAGTFHHPSAVLCDTGLLATLDDDEFASGLGEVIKTAIIGGEPALASLEQRVLGLLEREPVALQSVIAECVRTKAAVVADDPTERGRRKVLNLGHTFAHAIEHAAGYGRIPHGVAVGTGLALALEASERHFGVDPGFGDRVRSLLEQVGIPATLDALRASFEASPRGRVSLTRGALEAGLAHDKKSEVGRPRFVLARAPGDLVWDVELDAALVAELLA